MMTKNEIKKALEICNDADISCGDCPYHDDLTCSHTLKTDARELIIKQEQEIARLKAEFKQLETNAEILARGVRDLNHENYELTEKIKQAKIDVLNALKDKMFEREYMGVKYKERIFYESEIDDMIAEVQNAEDKS